MPALAVRLKGVGPPILLPHPADAPYGGGHGGLVVAVGGIGLRLTLDGVDINVSLRRRPRKRRRRLRICDSGPAAEGPGSIVRPPKRVSVVCRTLVDQQVARGAKRGQAGFLQSTEWVEERKSWYGAWSRAILSIYPAELLLMSASIILPLNP